MAENRVIARKVEGSFCSWLKILLKIIQQFANREVSRNFYEIKIENQYF